MDPTTRLREDAAACDFVAQYLDDRERGIERSLADYQSRFPEFAARIAAEFAAMAVDDVGTSEPARADARDVGPYRLLRRLGQGGQGVVFLAEHRELRRTVALKMLHVDVLGLNTARIARLRREAITLARLEHPSICSVYEVQLDAAPPYLAMRYVPGDSLATCIERARERDGALELPPHDRAALEGWLRFFEKAGETLHAAHQVGIVHRDVKPQNLIRTPQGEPVLLDFGLAREVGSATVSLTQPHEVFGTLPYLAPELLAGRTEPDPRADVYALGITLYETLTLRRPFAATTPEALRRQIDSGDVASARTLNPALPRDLEVVIATAIERAPERRYPTARAFAEDLRRIRQREPIVARPVGATVRAWRHARRHPVLGTAFVLLAIGLTVALALLAEVSRGRHELEALRAAYRALSLSERTPSRALHLAVEAARMAHHPEIHDILIQVLDRCHEERTIASWDAPDPGERVPCGTLDLSGDAIAVPFTSGRVGVFRIADGSTVRIVDHGASGPVQAAFVRGADRLLTAGADGRVRLWQVDDVVREWRPGDATAPAASSALAIAPDGRRAAVCGEDGGVWLIALDSNEAPVPCRGHSRVVTLALFDGHGERLLTLSGDSGIDHRGDRTVLLFDVSSGTALAQFGPSERLPRYAAWSPDGSRLAIGFDDGAIDVIRAADGATAVGCDHGGELNCIAFDPARPRLLSGGLAGLVVHDAETGAVLARNADFADRSVARIGFSPSGDHVAVGARDGSTRIFRADDLSPSRVFRAGPARPTDLRWTEDGERLVTVDSAVHVWYATRRPFLQSFSGHVDRVVSARFDRRGERIVSASHDGTARVHDVRTSAPIAVLEHGSPVRSARFGESHDLVVTTCEGSPPRLWRLSGRESIELGTAVARDAWLFDHDRRAVTTGDDGVLRIHDVPSGALRLEHRAHDSAIECAAWHPTRAWLATGAGDRVVAVFDCEREETVFTSAPWPWPHEEHTGRRVFGITFADDGRSVVAACEDQRIHRWSLDPDLPSWVGPRSATPGFVAGVNDGRHILVAGRWSAFVNLHDAANGALVGLAPVAPDNMIASLRVDAAGRVALCADKTGRVAVFETDPPRLLSTIRASAWPLLDAEFSPDGRFIVTAAADGSVRVWPVDPLPVAERHRPLRSLPDVAR